MDHLSSHIVIVVGGDPVAPAHVPSVDRDTLVVAADSGADLAHSLGWSVDVLVGDLDSISARSLGRLEDRGIDIDRYPTDKDATDLELALDAALSRAAAGAQVAVVGGAGGRLDHALAGTLALAAPAYADLVVSQHSDAAVVHVVHAGGHRRIDCPADATFSVVPVHGAATVSVTGARWPLGHADLAPGTTWGVSNIADEPPVTVTCHAGTALVVVPHHLHP